MPKVMLVEDDNNLREIYEARLQAEGYDIISAKDGEEALVVAKANKPDLVISDVMMPKISGFEMLDIMRNTEGLKEVKVIMLTALGQSDDQQRADKLGADRYLVKSQVTLEDIVKVAHELLQDTAAIPTAETTSTPAPAPAAPSAQPAAPQAPVQSTPAPTPPAAPPVQPAPAPAEPVAATPPSPAPAIPVASPPVDNAPTTPAAPTPTAAPTPSSQSAQSTAQEEANVEARIEDFVAGASSDPVPQAAPAPSPTPAPEPTAPAPTPVPSEPIAPPVQPAPAPAEPPKDSAQVAADDTKLLDDASNSLDASVKEATATPLAPAAEPVIPVTPEPAPVTPETKPEEPETDDDNVHIANKKVIQPLQTEPKKDIQTLLAIEEARDAATQGPPPPTAVIATNETGEQAQALAPAPPKLTATEFVASQQGVDEDKPAGAPAQPPSSQADQTSNPADPGSVAI